MNSVEFMIPAGYYLFETVLRERRASIKMSLSLNEKEKKRNVPEISQIIHVLGLSLCQDKRGLLPVLPARLPVCPSAC